MATKTSNLMEDTLTGKDELISVEDVFNSKFNCGSIWCRMTALGTVHLYLTLTQSAIFTHVSPQQCIFPNTQYSVRCF